MLNTASARVFNSVLPKSESRCPAVEARRFAKLGTIQPREGSRKLLSTTRAYENPGNNFSGNIPRIEASQQPLMAPRTQEMQGDPFALLLKERIVFLGGEVNDFVADAVVSQILLLESLDPKKDIKFFINSPGGSVTAGMAIYDAMMVCIPTLILLFSPTSFQVLSGLSPDRCSTKSCLTRPGAPAFSVFRTGYLQFLSRLCSTSLPFLYQVWIPFAVQTQGRAAETVGGLENVLAATHCACH
uniref:ATP-dependent Clp protease proteolytic subunit n=1 Tax=Tetraselmis sp. GSL018 TaxID=582737 RepID=A0A061RYY3_9CHLO|eukprot:CAMPEP_0177613616 /NCGR_PEP_ID=MMETSP0419_2-20121207/22102_1 /TAXON_ID=582737 /ORGANISM="Tetraselmis sp., Strain GSL018" /LENGTH=242 /DNA_ID=CAMNT_0019110389 /DNA_START=38 /DNA_END=766 /DNA_ORIENTATION=-